MNITATMVKELRDKTGAGMMDAKKALVETDGDMEKAMEGEKSLDALGREKAPDILDALLYIARQNILPPGPLCELPLPASGLGYLSYEFAKHCDNIRFFEQKDDLNIP